MFDHTLTLLFPRDKPDCTLGTCPIRQSSFGYYPSLGANLTFLIIFFLSFAANAVQGVMYGKRTISFAILLCINNALEVVGYAGRANAHNNPFLKVRVPELYQSVRLARWSVGRLTHCMGHQNPFLIQIICLTIAPLFMCAGIYLCLGIMFVPSPHPSPSPSSQSPI